MPATVTVTGVTGPGVALAATVFTNVASFSVNTFNAEVLTLTFADSKQPKEVSIAAATTITVTVSGVNYTVTIS